MQRAIPEANHNALGRILSLPPLLKTHLSLAKQTSPISADSHARAVLLDFLFLPSTSCVFHSFVESSVGVSGYPANFRLSPC